MIKNQNKLLKIEFISLKDVIRFRGKDKFHDKKWVLNSLTYNVWELMKIGICANWNIAMLSEFRNWKSFFPSFYALSCIYTQPLCGLMNISSKYMKIFKRNFKSTKFKLRLSWIHLIEINGNNNLIITSLADWNLSNYSLSNKIFSYKLRYKNQNGSRSNGASWPSTMP